MNGDAQKILKKARNLIANPARWTQGAEAKDGNGISIAPWHACARCWCATGALRCAGDWIFDSGTMDRAIERLAHALPGFDGACPWANVVMFNDTSDHAAVLAAFDRAIAAVPDGAP